jgi:type II secretory pathway pseudopilin PulG
MMKMSSFSATTPRRKRGFSLMEAAVVLGVVGLVIGGIWGVAASVRASMQSNQLHQQTLNLVSSIRDYYANRPLPAVAGAITSTLSGKGIFPEEMCPANCVSAASPSSPPPLNAYGGTTTVTIPNPATYSNQFSVTYLSVDKKGCMELGMKLSARAPEIGLVSFAAGGGTRTTFPIPLATLKGDCPGSNITLYFKIRM